MASTTNCQICSSTNISTIYEASDMPALIGVLWDKKEDAIHCPKGNITLAFCGDCGFIWNVEFNPTLLEYRGAYDNSLHFSQFYQEYAKSVANRLVKNYKLYNKDIIEIGAGKIDFLLMLCELGNNRGVGFDPSFNGISPGKGSKITLIKDYYSEKYSNYTGDLICSRHVFEHIPKPKEFLALIRRTIDNRLNTIVYLEVPHVLFILSDLSVWDIIYEHCSYFNVTSLQRVFHVCGFKINSLTEVFGGQFLSIEAQPSDNVGDLTGTENDDIRTITILAKTFSENNKMRLREWKDMLLKLEASKKKIVVWGAGAKGVSFLNMLQIKDQIRYVVDVNPRKKDKYMPGTGHQIVLPSFLTEYKPDTVIVMNHLYKNEIQQTLKELGLSAECVVA